MLEQIEQIEHTAKKLFSMRDWVDMSEQNRRDFLRHLAIAAGGVVLVPVVSACSTMESGTKGAEHALGKNTAAAAKSTAEDMQKELLAYVPKAKPEGFEPVSFNKARGNAGAIPETYHASINGEDGDTKHLGKHLPFVPKLADASVVPAGFVAIMWGDPEKGHARHPNAPKSESNPQGHWYNWIKIRKAVESDDVEELQSTYTNWPGLEEGATGAYAVFGGGDMHVDGGKNTIYLAGLPKDVKSKDTVRVWAHCLTHGEYVDFITVP